MKYTILLIASVICLIQQGDCGIFDFFKRRPKGLTEFYQNLNISLQNLYRSKLEFSDVLLATAAKLSNDTSKPNTATLWLNTTLRDISAITQREIRAQQVLNVTQIGLMGNSERLQDILAKYNKSNEGIEALIKEVGTRIAAIVDSAKTPEEKDAKYVKLIQVLHDPLISGTSNYSCDFEVAATKIKELLERDHNISKRDVDKIAELLAPLSVPDAPNVQALLDKVKQIA